MAHKHGAFKQVNKKHKVRYDNFKAKKFGKTETFKNSLKKKGMNKIQRDNKKIQVRKHVMKVKKLEKELFIRSSPTPLIISGIPLFNNYNFNLLNFFLSENNNTIYKCCNQNLLFNTILDIRALLYFIKPSANLFSILDIVKISNIVFFLLPPVNTNIESVIQEINLDLLECIISQGINNVYFLYENITADMSSHKLTFQDNYNKGFAKFYYELLQKYIPEPQIMHADKLTNTNFKNSLVLNKKKSLNWINDRPLLITDHIDYKVECIDDGSRKKIKISGWLKTLDKPFLAHQLVHIPALNSTNNFRIERIELISPDPYHKLTGSSFEDATINNNNDHMETEQNFIEKDVISSKYFVPNNELFKTILERNSKLIETMDVGDRPLFYETAPIELKNSSNMAVPLVDELKADTIEDMVEPENVTKHLRFNQNVEQINNIDQDEHMDIIDLDSKDAETEECDDSNNEFFRLPTNIPARERLKKYRGLKSFAQTPWDTSTKFGIEHKPDEYAKIMQFENFKRSVNYTEKYMRDLWDAFLDKCEAMSSGEMLPLNEKPAGSRNKKSRKRSVSVGSNISAQFLERKFNSSYYTLTIDGFSQSDIDTLVEMYENREDRDPLILFGLLPYEQNISVLNFGMRKSFAAPTYHSSTTTIPCENTTTNCYEGETHQLENESDESRVIKIKSKTKLMFQVGFRRFYNCPIFSEQSLNSKGIDKFKFEKYFRFDDHRMHMATMFTNITLKNVPVLVFKTHGDLTSKTEADQLIAQGSFYSVDPGRVIIKRIILHGQPYKINGRTAIIRFMFYNPDDVEYFKDIELKTKLGRIGHIKEPLGTHGLMKCTFNSILKPNDIVYMYLYKRVYPKWLSQQQTCF